MASSKSLQQFRVNDPVLTSIVHGYCQAQSIAPFVAPTVPVGLRAGKVIKFTKEQFATVNTRRAPGSVIQRVTSSFDNEGYYLEQWALASEVTEEEYQEAINGEARIDLRTQAALRTSALLMLDWEREVVQTVTDPTKYELTNTAVIPDAVGIRFDEANSDPEVTVQGWKEAIRAQVGCYPNRAIISTDVYNALKFHPIFRDRVKYTSVASINLDMLATWFDLDEIRVAQKVQLNADGTLVDVMPNGTFLLFYSPEGKMEQPRQQGFMPLESADRAVPAFAYTYLLKGYPIAMQERFEEDRRVFVSDIIAEQSIQMTGLGANGLVGSGYLAVDVVG